MKRLSCLFMTLPLVLSSCGNNPPPEPVAYSFQAFESRTLDVHFSETYFDTPSSTPNLQLASFAMGMSALSPAWSDPEIGPVGRIKAFYKEIGMESTFFSSNYDLAPAPGSVAYSIASKKTYRGKTLILLAIRSDSYYGEWVDNFDMGLEGDFHGFLVPAKKVYEGLKDFIVDFELEGEAIISINGLSRGAAVGTLVGGMIDDDIANGNTRYGNVSISFENTYVYGIETPAPSAKSDYASSRYQNIHNYFNINDLLAYLPWRSFGFHTLGTNHYFSDRLTDIHYAERLPILAERMQETGGEAFSYPENVLSSLVSAKTDAYPSYGRNACLFINKDDPTWIPSRKEYVEQYQEAMMWVAAFIFADDRSKQLADAFQANLFSFMLHLVDFEKALDALREGDTETAKAKILSIYEDVVDDGGETYAILVDLFNNITPVLGLAGDVLASRKETLNPLTVMNLLTPMAVFHRSSPFAWLSSYDGNHGRPLDESVVNDGSYYRLEVRNLDFFQLTLQEGSSLFKAANAQILSSSLSAAIRDGTLSLFLPKNASYAYIASENSAIALYEVKADCTETAIETGLPKSGNIKEAGK